MSQPVAHAAEPLLEVLDLGQRVVALLPAAEVIRQKLPHRAVCVLLHDEQGRLLLRRRQDEPAPGRWDVPARGPVLAEEAVQDAATRCLEERLGIHAERLRPLVELPALPESGNEHLHVFSVSRAEPLVLGGGERDSGDYLFSPEELACLLRDFRELVAPRFLHLAEGVGLRGARRAP